jgi:hypothetical protein
MKTRLMKAVKVMPHLDKMTLACLMAGVVLVTIAVYRWLNQRPISLPAQTLNLQQLIGDLRHQLLEAEDTRRHSGEPALFRIGKCDIEVNVVVRYSDTVTGGFKYEVITAEQAREYSSEQVQKVTLHLDSVEQREVVIPPSDPNSIK